MLDVCFRSAVTTLSLVYPITMRVMMALDNEAWQGNRIHKQIHSQIRQSHFFLGGELVGELPISAIVYLKHLGVDSGPTYVISTSVSARSFIWSVLDVQKSISSLLITSLLHLAAPTQDNF